MKFCLSPPPQPPPPKNFDKCWFVETNTNLTKVILTKSKKFKIQIENNKYLVNLTCTLDFNWLWLELHKRKALIACTVCRIVGLKASCIYCIYKVNILNSSQIVVFYTGGTELSQGNGLEGQLVPRLHRNLSPWRPPSQHGYHGNMTIL